MVARIFVDQHLPDSGQMEIVQPSRIHYIHRVLRIKKNTVIRVFGLCQREFCALVESISTQAIRLRLVEQVPSSPESPVRIALGQSISRGQRMDYTVQKTTELGVNSITPLYSQHSQHPVTEQQSEKKREHWAAVALHATEQSNRLVVPEIFAARKLEQWLAQADQTVRFVLHEKCHEEADFSREELPDSVALLIGPEGGLSDSEVAMACDYGFIAVQLGPRVLRTETAAPVMMALVQWFWGDLRG